MKKEEELLKACKKALAVAEGWIHDQMDGTSGLNLELSRLDSVRRAIAKAEKKIKQELQ